MREAAPARAFENENGFFRGAVGLIKESPGQVSAALAD
jgi:hypothetical protein